MHAALNGCTNGHIVTIRKNWENTEQHQKNMKTTDQSRIVCSCVCITHNKRDSEMMSTVWSPFLDKKLNWPALIRLVFFLTMRASCPTTRPAHPLSHLIQSHLYPPLSRFFFLCRYHPTNPLISSKWCYVLPESAHFRIRINCPFQISRYFMRHSARGFFGSGHHTLNNIRLRLIMN